MPQVLTSLQVPNYGSAPSSPLKGQVYCNTSDNLFYYYNGLAWVSLVPSGGGGNVSNVGSPSAGQIASWTGLTTIQGIPNTMSQWDGGATGLTASTGRTSLGATTIGGNLFTLANPAAVSWLKTNGLGAVTQEDAPTTRTSLGLVIGTNVQAWDSDLDTVATATPGNLQYYGTNASGTKGFYALQSPSKVLFLTSGTTYTPSAGVRALFVECNGAGGGGGGAVASASNATGGGGGGGGGWAAKYITGTIKANYVYTIGAAGTAGAATGTNGVAGGATTFDSASVCTANGGGLGVGSATGAATAAFPANGGAGGTGSVGDATGVGGDGGPAIRLSGTQVKGGDGGGCPIGGLNHGALNGAAGVGGVPGQGGSGGSSISATGFAGGVGGAGYIKIIEFF